MGAPARVLPVERHTAPRLALVDNMGMGARIVAEAQRQQVELIDGPEPERLQIPVNRSRPRRLKPATERSGKVHTVQVNQVVLGVAELICDRHGYKLKIIDATTVLLVNPGAEGR